MKHYKKYKKYLSKEISAHFNLLLSIGALLISFLAMLFLYNNFYITQKDIADAYLIKSNLNIPAIDADSFNAAYDLLWEKINYSDPDISSIHSPFSK